MPDIIAKIEEARARNNKLWMMLLRIAVSKEPKKASKILRDINKNDKKISTLLEKI